MKARIQMPTVHVTQKQLKDAVDKEVQRRYREIVARSCVDIMALVLFTLDKQYGFRKKRLWRFLNEMQASDKLLNRGLRDARVSSYDVLGYLKERYLIDLEEELLREVEE